MLFIPVISVAVLCVFRYIVSVLWATRENVKKAEETHSLTGFAFWPLNTNAHNITCALDWIEIWGGAIILHGRYPSSWLGAFMFQCPSYIIYHVSCIMYHVPKYHQVALQHVHFWLFCAFNFPFFFYRDGDEIHII